MEGIGGTPYVLPSNPAPEDLQKYLAALRRLTGELPQGFDTVADIEVDTDGNRVDFTALLVAVAAGEQPVRVTHRLECVVRVDEFDRDGQFRPSASCIEVTQLVVETMDPVGGQPRVVDLTRPTYEADGVPKAIPGFPMSWWMLVRDRAALLTIAANEFPRILAFGL